MVETHKQILSDKEKEMLRQFLSKGETTETFRMLKLRIRKNHARLREDLDLIEQALKKFT